MIHLLAAGLTKAELIVGLKSDLPGWHDAFDAMHSGRVIKSVLLSILLMALLSDRIALVTGSTSGIGRGIARRFAALGAKVVVHGRDQAAASQTLEAIVGEGGEASWFAADLADAAACRRLVAFTVERFGGLDILVNNAALTTRGDIEHVPLDTVDSIFAVNLRAPLLLMQAAIPHIKARGGGAIVNIGSVNAYIGEPKLCPVLGVEGRADDAHEERCGVS